MSGEFSAFFYGMSSIFNRPPGYFPGVDILHGYILNGAKLTADTGTLMAPEVFYSVCYGSKSPPQVVCDLHTFTPAMLDDYCRHRVRFADYPGVVAGKGHSVLGVYVTGLTSANMYKLDRFEGSEYKRIMAQVRLVQNGEMEVQGEMRDTSVYVFLNAEGLEKREWDFEEFRKEKLHLWLSESVEERLSSGSDESLT